MLNILLISQYCSNKVFNDIISSSLSKIGYAGPKFYKLISEGFFFHNTKCILDNLSTLPISHNTHSKVFWKTRVEKNGESLHIYLPIINLKFLRNIILIPVASYYLIKYFYSKKSDNKVVIIDMLGYTVATISLFICKILKIKTYGIITDLPPILYADNTTNNFINKSIKYLILKYYSQCSGFISLTTEINTLINKNNKPFFLMQGLVDHKMAAVNNYLENKCSKRIILYAGSYYQKYGLLNLLNAFIRIKDNSLQLSLYGSGPFESVINNYALRDSRIINHGLVSNDVVISAEIKSTLLVNPRFSDAIYTKYSFPSKNFEYMVSGTPLLTTKLHGISNCDINYLFIIEDESVDGIFKSLTSILFKSDAELNRFGNLSKEYILSKQSNILQALKMINFFNNN